jgi:hypothetical protein
MVEVIEEYGGAGLLTYFPNMIKKEVIAVKTANNNTGAMAGVRPRKQRRLCKISSLQPSC